MSDPEPIIPPAQLQRSQFAEFGKLVYRHRKLVILGWIALVAFSLVLIHRLDQTLQGTGMIYRGGEANQAEQILQQELDLDPDAVTLVFQSQRSIPAASPESIQPILNQIYALPAVRSVISAQDRPAYRSLDGKTQYAIARLNVQGSEIAPALDQIQQILSRGQARGLRTFLTGKLVVDRDIQQISKADLGQVERRVLPLTLVVLLAVFGSIVAASMPVVIGVTAVSITLGLLYFISLRLSISIFALNITSMLGLGLGIDYSLLIVNRFREELATHSIEQAVVQTVDAAGRAVFFSGLTVCIGLFALSLVPIGLLHSLSIAGSLVVLVSVAAALTLLPALLGLLGHRINGGSRTQRRSFQLVWERIARLVIGRSGIAIAGVLILVAGLTSPFLAIRFGSPDASILPQSLPARTGVQVLEQAFGLGEVSPILLAVQSKSDTPLLSEAHVETLHQFVKRLQGDARVAKVQSLFNLDVRLKLPDYQRLYRHPAAAPPPLAAAIQQLSSYSTTLIVVTSRYSSNDLASQTLVQDLRAESLRDLELQVTGQTANGLDTIAIIRQRLPWVIFTVITVTFFTLCILLGSIVLPLKAIAMNFLSIGASFGALVFIFQEGNFQTWFNFTPVGYLDILLPVVLFCILFGLSMDYEVFLLTRIKEAYDRGNSNVDSIIEGLKSTGGMITSAALMMIIVTSAFAFTSIIFVKALGLGTAIAVFIDATLIRVILVPATMHLLGRWNWWSPSKCLRSAERSGEIE